MNFGLTFYKYNKNTFILKNNLVCFFAQSYEVILFTTNSYL